ncbi:hypothetical protein ABFA07_017067 [Porites harrisoni]
MERNVLICKALLLIFLTSVAAAMVINPKKKISNLPFIESFGLQGKIIPYIGSKVNLTCKMKHAEAGIFLKAGLAIREGGRFRYIFEDSGHDGLVAHLEITDVSKEDEGVFTCCAFRAGIITTKTLTFQTAPYPPPSITSLVVDSKGLLQFP